MPEVKISTTSVIIAKKSFKTDKATIFDTFLYSRIGLRHRENSTVLKLGELTFLVVRIKSFTCVVSSFCTIFIEQDLDCYKCSTGISKEEIWEAILLHIEQRVFEKVL